ncbi:unnamed protein product [Pelagomonas calceolata]|uniref:Uncharacterized protein n=1 Tax=Pelagomonas calceolata TaxID=35677 RepID=A0A8J2S6F1_9STRA|nr:unnamed protein product [Pelagomonas calceolata]
MLLITALLVTNAAALAPPLRTLLSRSAKPKAREEAITLITEMEREERDKFLDYVNTVRDTPSKLARRPLMRYAPISWSARDLAALDRVLDIGGVPEDDASKRRVVLSTLRQLANTRGVLKLEREARRRARLSASFDEMLERTPKIGTPAFEIVEEQGAFQVRRYADFAVVRTARQRAVSDDGVKLGEPKMSGAGAFQALAGYIFGKNKRDEKMAMTTPVFTRAGQLLCRNQPSPRHRRDVSIPHRSDGVRTTGGLLERSWEGTGARVERGAHLRRGRACGRRVLWRLRYEGRSRAEIGRARRGDQRERGLRRGRRDIFRRVQRPLHTAMATAQRGARGRAAKGRGSAHSS